MLDDLRRFSTDAFPEDLRQSAWDEALAQLGLASSPPAPGTPPLCGHVWARRSPLASVYARMNASAQVWRPQGGPRAVPGQAVLVLVGLKGRARVLPAEGPVELHADAIAVLDPSQAWAIDWRTDFEALVLRLDAASFVLRLLRTRCRDLNLVDGRTGVGAVCLSLVRSLAAELDRLQAHELLPIEATLTELLVTGLSQRDASLSVVPDDDATSVQLAHLRRVCRYIEASLGDAELSLDAVARHEGLSARYVQKLFQGASTRFGDYLKSRRLERCRLDLANSALGNFTIAELCFRWGFNDAANFSRAFTARFGLSPRAYRQQPPTPTAAPRQRGAQAPGAGRRAAAARTDDGKAGMPDHASFVAVLNDHERYAQALALAPKRASFAPVSTGTAQACARESPHSYYLPVSDKTVHWGFFSRTLKPALSVRSGDYLTIETLTQHASDDAERMIDGDPGAESVFGWTPGHKAVRRRGAGPMDASAFGRGAGEGFGVHICTGPVYVHDAEPGDVLEVRILDIQPRASCHPSHRGRVFGSNAAAWWGYQYHDLLTEPKQREVVTLYELHTEGPQPHARALYNFRWTPQTDPDGVRHETIDYPGVVVDPASVERRHGVLAKARVPVRPHFGVLAVAPKEDGLIDSIPPSYFGGNLDNWRAGPGARVFLPVSVAGALFSVGDPHASQGDGEVCGTAIECSLTGRFQLVLHKRADIQDPFLAQLNHPFLESEDAWVLQGFSHANYLAELGPQAQTLVYQQSTLDEAMRDAFRKVRCYLMQAHGLDEDEALSLMSVAVDFGITQVADGNWGVHAIVRKAIFPAPPEAAAFT